jgi:signal transduction histidine kinase
VKRALAALAACLVLLLLGMGGLTAVALDLEGDARTARRRAAVEEDVRLALWRMDSAVAPLLAREASMGLARSDFVRGRFRVHDGGDVTPPPPPGLALARDALVGIQPPRVARGREERSAVEYQMRAKSVTQAANVAIPEVEDRWMLRAETLRPAWTSGELVLARRAPGDEEVIEVIWLDWAALRRFLLAEAADLFPAGKLDPAAPGDGGERLLASLPARFDPGPAARPFAAEKSALGWVLGGAWGAVLLAAAALAALLVGTVALSERRAAFVSAVTHELRTPLTTLRTYTEMLAGGMVREEKRQGYLETLAREATRLAHLVENVLLYARLERGRGPGRVAPAPAWQLLEAARPRLEDRAAGAGMTVALAAPEGLVARADPAAVEQILFNLVDNACKYAGGGEVRVTAAAEGGDVVVRVADDGPGIAPAERGWLFEPFARSAERAAGAAPGVGLGLALCRRLAKAMGGDLVLEDVPGCVFALRLRRGPGSVPP